MANSNIPVIQACIQACGVIVASFLSVLVYQLNRRKNKDEARLQKPVINVHNFEGVGYVILNMGKGPALNVRFAESNGANWEEAFIGYSLPVNTYFPTKKFFMHNAAIAVAYNDLLGNDYLMIARSDTSTIHQRGEKGFDKAAFKHLHTEPNRTDKMPLLGKL
jgi:hypothetical protein